jgi:hypothetical protein
MYFLKKVVFLARYRVRVARYDEEKKKYIDLASVRFETDLHADKVIGVVSTITQTIQTLIEEEERIRAILEQTRAILETLSLSITSMRVEKHG